MTFSVSRKRLSYKNKRWMQLSKKLAGTLNLDLKILKERSRMMINLPLVTLLFKMGVNSTQIPVVGSALSHMVIVQTLKILVENGNSKMAI
jgi:hypothetical protein